MVQRTPMTYFTDGDDVALIASNGGSPNHPAWCHNVPAHPEVELSEGQVIGRYVGREAEGAEGERVWRAGVTWYPGWATYQSRTQGGRIPVLVFPPL